MAMDFLFGRRKTPEEMLRQNQRALNKAMRDLDRERTKMEQQEKKIINDIKKMAKENQMVTLFSMNCNPVLNYCCLFIRFHIMLITLKVESAIILWFAKLILTNYLDC